MKKIITGLIISLFAIPFASAFEMPFFNGYTGLLGSLNNNELTGQMMMSGQVDFSSKLLLRSGFYIQTQNLSNKQIFSNATNPNSFFTLEEISATYKFSLGNTANYAAVFIGNYEPIGSSIFLQRQFGVKSIASSLTESWHGLNGASIYKMDGKGAAYTIKVNQTLALGTYIYGTKDETLDCINTDIRAGGVFDKVVFDSIFGFGFPMERTLNDEKVLLLVRTLTMHGGASVLIGNSYDNSLFIQAGVRNIFFDAKKSSTTKKNDISNIYLFIEPRFVVEVAQLDLAFFMLPVDNMKDMLYLSIIPEKYPGSKFSVGNNIGITSSQFTFGSVSFKCGIHFSTLITDVNFKILAENPVNIFKWKYDILMTPFINVNLLGGSLASSLNLNFLDLIKGPTQAIKLNIGFSTQL